MQNLLWNQIYREQAPRLLGLCRRYVRDTRVAEDLVHDAFITAIGKQADYSGKGTLEGWLRKITLHTALQYLRKEKRLLELARAEIPDAAAETEDADPENAKSLILNAGFEQSELLEVLDTLPDHHRAVFNLYVFEGYTHAAIAAELGISQGTSKSHLARARKKIQERLLEKAMQRKQKRAALFLIPASQKEPHFVDDLYLKSLAEHAIPPAAPPPGNLQDILHKPLPPAAKFTKAFWAKTALASLAGALIIALAFGPLQTDKAVARPEYQSAAPVLQENPVLLPAVASSTPADTQPFKQEQKQTRKKPESGLPAPVVVHRPVVQKDTVFQYAEPEQNHE